MVKNHDVLFNKPFVVVGDFAKVIDRTTSCVAFVTCSFVVLLKLAVPFVVSAVDSCCSTVVVLRKMLKSQRRSSKYMRYNILVTHSV